MNKNDYKTIQHIDAIISNDIPESLTLEYKSSSILVNGKAEVSLCKAVTAFANSVGGHFLIGVESLKGRSVRLDGGSPHPSKRDWIHKIINANTFPALESVDVREIQTPTGIYYVVEVAPSSKAPHQSNDHKYYKRRGPHSEPMEHYEIQDVRNRPKDDINPLRVSLVLDEFLVRLRFRNEHRISSVTNLKCQIETNFELDRRGTASLCERGLRDVKAQDELLFMLDAGPAIADKSAEPEMQVRLTYEFQGNTINDTVSFFIADLLNTSIVRDPLTRAINELSENMEKIRRELKDIKNDIDKLLSISDGSGLRLSVRTIELLRNPSHKHIPTEFDWRGYQVVLNVSAEDAFKLDYIFRGYGNLNDQRVEYEKLTPELRHKFERFFKVEFIAGN